MNEKYTRVKEKLEKYNQGHLLSLYSDLSEIEKEKLLDQILSIDFDMLLNFYQNRNSIKNEKCNIEPINYISKFKLSENEKNIFLSLGKEAIKSNKLAVCILAGGQGTRLGHNGPKGTFIVNLKEPKSIFELFIDNLKKAYTDFGIYISIYFMTSEENNEQTIDFFENNNYFGYPKEKINFFKQGQLPLVDTNGKLILEKKFKIKEAADGNGGIFEALYTNNVLAELKENGIQYLFVGNIDNILLKTIDPLQLGILINNNNDIISNSILKTDPNEKVGLFCLKNGKPGVAEYIEISPDLMNLRKEDNNLVFSQAYYGASIFKIDFLEKISIEKLPYHSAFKKSDYLNSKGELIKSTEPNVYKFETFIFDAFEKTDKISIFNVKREEEFAPIKNAEGNDSPETAIKLYNNYYNI